MRLFPRSTTLRFAALVFLLQLGAAVALLFSVRELTRGRVAAEAEAITAELRDDLLATYAEGGLDALIRTITIRTERGGSAGTVVLLADGSGRRLAGNLGAWPPTLRHRPRPVGMVLYRVGRTTPERMEVSATPLPGGARLLTGHVIDTQLRFASTLEAASLNALLLAVAFAAFAAWAAARMIENRLGRTVSTVRAVEAGRLDARVPVSGGGDVFDALAAALNAMLDRLDSLVDELKIATDGLAHDLKSPLTRLQAALERAAVQTRDPEAEAAINHALEEGGRLHATVETALSIIRAEAGIGADGFTDTDLAALVGDLAELYGPLAEDHGTSVAAKAAGPTILRAHRELMSRAVANLIDNALKYGAGPITLNVAEGGGSVSLSVADRGPGIAPERRAHALRRFGRLDEARRGSGAGLGLSLVAAVARLHGGSVALLDNEPGLKVVLTFPRT